MRTFIFLLFFLAASCSVKQTKSQNKTVDNQFTIWMSNVNSYHINPNWYFKSEIHIRRARGFEQWQQFLVRPGINYKLNKTVTFSAGYSYILSYPYGDQPIPIRTPEHNVWEQVGLNHSSEKVKFNHRFRVEHRFAGNRVLNDQSEYFIDGYGYQQRLRYRFTGKFPLTKNGKFFAKWFDELFINLADNFMPLGMDQNWLYLGFGFNFTERANIQLGYMNQLIKKGNLNLYESNHTLQFTIGYKFGNFVKK